MARSKTAPEETVLQQVNSAREAIKRTKLKELAVRVSSDAEHPLHKLLNSYPPIPYEISSDDLKVIAMLNAFPGSLPDEHDWTPLEKIFYALLWKDGKLEAIKRIIEGAESASDQSTSSPNRAIVYHYFGRHLVDRLREPVIDQHTTRAFRLLTMESRDDLDDIRAIVKLTNEDAVDYCTWYVRTTTEEGIKRYEDSRKIDSFLFALGKFAKRKGNNRVPVTD